MAELDGAENWKTPQVLVLEETAPEEKETVSTETALGTFFCIAGIEAGHMYMYMLVMVHAATKSSKLRFGFYPHNYMFLNSFCSL